MAQPTGAANTGRTIGLAPEDAFTDEAGPQLTAIDGYLWDEDGVCHGPAELPKPTFAVDDDQALDWVLNKMLQEEAAIAAVDQTDAVIHARAVLANAERIKKDHENRLKGLHFRFDNEIEHYVRPLLEGAKTKTYKRIFGAVSFRTVKGGLRVKDPDAALALAKDEFPNAVKVSESFLVSQLTDDQRAEIEKRLAAEPTKGDGLVPMAFEIRPDSESMTVKTGVQS